MKRSSPPHPSESHGAALDFTGARARRARLVVIPASLITIFTAYLIFAACAPLYMPNAMRTSLPQKRGTVQGTFHYGAGSYNGGIVIAPVDSFSIFGAYSHEPYSARTGDSMNGWPAVHVGHRFLEVGLGHTFMLDTFMRDTTTIELLAGYGAGTARAFWPIDSTVGVLWYPSLDGVYQVDGDYQRIFVQVNKIHREKYDPKDGSYKLEGLAVRTSYVWFTRGDREDRSPIQPRAIFIDPAFFAVGGYKNIQWELQMGVSIKVPMNSHQLRYSWIFVELGVRGLIDGLW